MPETTPLAATAATAGAVFVEEHGWLMPARYSDPAAEYRSACASAAVFDVSHHGKIELGGKDAVSFLHNLCTNELNNLPAGSGCEAFLTTSQAKIVAYVLIYRVLLKDGTTALWIDAGPGMGEAVAKHLDRHLISEQVEISDKTRELAQLHLVGPRANAVLTQALRAEPPTAASLQHQKIALAGADVYLRRHDPLAAPGWDILCPAEQAIAVWQALISTGGRPAGLEAYRILRVEAGTPAYGEDIDESNLPQEVGRTDQTISFTKGCYVGQETVARIRTYGHVNRSLVGLKLAGAEPVPRGTKIWRDGKEVGQTTTSVASPRLGQAIALAYVRRGNQEPGTAVEVQVAESRRTAEIRTLPFAGSGAGAG
jgi:folate-binding protein YgfZ